MKINDSDQVSLGEAKSNFTFLKLDQVSLRTRGKI